MCSILVTVAIKMSRGSHSTYFW